ncbi:MAG: carboxypeptidase [Tissierellia bacterium]|nr:carboxypeptidase [Tissierellia bacterium]
MISKWYQEIKELTENIFHHPELGYEEWHTRKITIDYIKKNLPQVTFKDFARTGFAFDLPGAENKELKMCYVAELDAVYLPSHFQADPKTGAAHVCGHYTQVGIALALLKELLEDDFYKSLDFGVGFVFVPAEEYLDLEHRKALREQGEIYYLGGKPEGMRLGIFDSYDFAISAHAMGGEYPEPSIEFLSDLAGFLFKYYHFKGKASHAGFAPWDGVNACSIGVLFQNAIGLLRQQIDETKMIRMNPVFLNGPMGINVIPDEVEIGTDLRSNSTEYMLLLAKKLDQAAKGSALALGGEVEIKTEMGYLPFLQDRFLSQLGLEFFEEYKKIPKCYHHRPIAAAGDIGDLSYMIPCVQIGYSGFTGTIHGSDFKHKDLQFILSDFPAFLKGYLGYLSGKVKKENLYRRSYEEYKEVIDELNKES